MALIQCPDCFNDFSDRAEKCPYCGGPNPLMADQQRPSTRGQVVTYREPPAPQPITPPPAVRPPMQPAQYQQMQNMPASPPQQPPIYHDPTATFVDPEEPFRNNSFGGVIRGQASFRATVLWWIVGWAVFGYFAFETNTPLMLIPALIWFWGGIFIMFMNARNIYSGKLKTIVFWVLGILFVLLIVGANSG